jgi:ligand-binding SRPBCC domain-containing protein
MKKVFMYRSEMPGTVEQLAAVHAHPKTFARLTMPPLIMQVLEDTRTSLIDGKVAFRLWFGPIPVFWLARHEAGPSRDSFTDVQEKGPLLSWEHEHIFEKTEEGTHLVDRITFSHKAGISGLMTRLLFDGLPLRMLFIYRHWQTRRMMRSSQFTKDNELKGLI